MLVWMYIEKKRGGFRKEKPTISWPLKFINAWKSGEV
jgi:hypothetical protein